MNAEKLFRTNHPACLTPQQIVDRYRTLAPAGPTGSRQGKKANDWPPHPETVYTVVTVSGRRQVARYLLFLDVDGANKQIKALEARAAAATVGDTGALEYMEKHGSRRHRSSAGTAYATVATFNGFGIVEVGSEQDDGSSSDGDIRLQLVCGKELRRCMRDDERTYQLLRSLRIGCLVGVGGHPQRNRGAPSDTDVLELLVSSITVINPAPPTSASRADRPWPPLPPATAVADGSPEQVGDISNQKKLARKLRKEARDPLRGLHAKRDERRETGHPRGLVGGADRVGGVWHTDRLTLVFNERTYGVTGQLARAAAS